MNKLLFALCLAAVLTACETPVQAEESEVGTAWQCGRDYLVITSCCGAAQEGLIWPNRKEPRGDGEQIMIHQLGHPPPDPFLWKNYPKNCQLTYYDKKRYKPCAKAKPPQRTKLVEQEVNGVHGTNLIENSGR
jgi:hypothetical protein